ncbi:hypothetical protein TNCT_52761 [Trichonephila clavata]|uniref:Uncharacterized protein n=1 Tax=Trichonephila clavata TaxID=2740835 RepID=A0A8X6GAT1_TRICU|nr:hypothetical protein TNCT_52761 [Trichonephila clavata]
MAACGSDPSTSNTTKTSKKESLPQEIIKSTQNEKSDFTFLQAIMEIKKIFDLSQTLLKEMEKSVLTQITQKKNSPAWSEEFVPLFPAQA